jgi:hypothetical protein
MLRRNGSRFAMSAGVPSQGSGSQPSAQWRDTAPKPPVLLASLMTVKEQAGLRPHTAGAPLSAAVAPRWSRFRNDCGPMVQGIVQISVTKVP